MHPSVALESNELDSTLILLSGFPEAIGITGLLDAIGLDAVEELVALNEDRFLAAGRDLDNLFFFFLILYPLRHRGAAYQAEILGAASGAEMTDIEQMKKRLFHTSRLKFPLVNMSSSWCLVSMYLIWILVYKLILSNNQSRATLWVLEHVSLWDSFL